MEQKFLNRPVAEAQHPGFTVVAKQFFAIRAKDMTASLLVFHNCNSLDDDRWIFTLRLSQIRKTTTSLRLSFESPRFS